MTVMYDTTCKAIHQEALQRHARQRVDQIDELRAAKYAIDRGISQRGIAEMLLVSQAKVHRLSKALERRGWNFDQDPEEIILRAFAYNSDRAELIEKLKAFPYTFGEDAPPPHEGRIPGTWDQILVAYARDLLSKEEFDEIRRAIGR